MNHTKTRLSRLSRRQEQILTFIREHILQRGFPPTIREIGETVGLSSSSTVHSHLRAMEAKGHIRRDPARPRSIQLVEREPGRVERLEALVRDARPWAARFGEGGQEWLERAATVCPVDAPRAEG